MIVIFIKACIYNRHQRVVGMITKLSEDKASEAIEDGLVKPYDGVYPPKKKTKINLKDLK